jgi:hypothetical protein
MELSRHCERSEAIQRGARVSGLLRRHSPSKTGVNALMAPRNDDYLPVEFQFWYNNCSNPDMFGTAIAGC